MDEPHEEIRDEAPDLVLPGIFPNHEQAAVESDQEAAMQRRIDFAKRLVSAFSQPTPSVASQLLAAYQEIMDDIIVDIAQQVHREARTSMKRPHPDHDASPAPDMGPAPVPLPAAAGVKGPVDVFGQSHPPKATDVVTCKNCGRQVQAGSFAPHLEKCMGKGRAAARAASRRMQSQG
mmetsp:Transcript_36866/g.81999  ORF Transcript_36866/g.81999 Transcript_36866/m.81999 type:complete len:177 (+) Transcript_36866:178-708(+)